MPLVIRTTGVEDYLDNTGQAFIKALIIGPPGAGKTRSASFWPKPIFADLEKGRMSLADRQVPYGEILTVADMDDFLRRVEAECRKPVQSRAWQTLVVDTLDAYQRMVTQERLRAERKEALSGFGDWGHLDAKMTGLIARLLKLPMNLVVNLHVKESKDGDDGPLVLGPRLKGDVKDQITADFDLVGHMTTSWMAEGGQRVLKRQIQWHPDPKFPVLKDRSGQLPRFTEVDFTPADFERIYLPIVGALDDLQAATDVETVERSGPEIGEVTAGGPVAQDPAKTEATAKAAKKAAPAKKTAAPPKAAEPKAEPTATKRTTPAKAQCTWAGCIDPTSHTDHEAWLKASKQVEAAADTAPVSDQEPPADGAEEQTGTDVPTQPSESSSDAPAQALARARAAVEEGLGGQVLSEPQQDDNETKEEQAAPTPEGDTCGTPTPGPPVAWATDGCGKDLSGENVDMVNIAVLKHKKKLCPACLKKANAAKNAA